MKNHVEHCNASEMLKGVGLSLTPHRLEVLKILVDSVRPLNAKDILDRKSGKSVNRVTVYRILSSLKKEGIIREMPSESGTRFYEVACTHNPVHPHFFCTMCGKLSCLEPLTLSQAWDWFVRPHSFHIDQVTISISGSCKDCNKE